MLFSNANWQHSETFTQHLNNSIWCLVPDNFGIFLAVRDLPQRIDGSIPARILTNGAYSAGPLLLLCISKHMFLGKYVIFTYMFIQIPRTTKDLSENVFSWWFKQISGHYNHVKMVMREQLLVNLGCIPFKGKW